MCCVGHAKRGTDIWWFNTVTWERHCYWAGAACLLWNDFWTQQLSGSGIPTTLTWLWVNTYKLPFLGGWTSIDPSYFDVNYRGTIGFDTLPHVEASARLVSLRRKGSYSVGWLRPRRAKRRRPDLDDPRIGSRELLVHYNILQYII